MSPRLALLTFAALAGAALLVTAAARVWGLERSELLDEGPLRSLESRLEDVSSTRISARLTEVELRAGERAEFEVCSSADMSGEGWEDALSFLVWLPARGTQEIKAPLDAEHLARVRRNDAGSCLTLGSGSVAQAGLYAVDAVFPAGKPPAEVMQAPLRARVLARVPLARREGLMVLGLALAGMLAVFAAFTSPGSVRPPVSQAPDSMRWAALGVVSGLALGAAVLAVPLYGSTGGLMRGLALAVLEVGVAVAFAVRLGNARALLALHAPPRAPWLSLVAAVALAALLNPAARLAMRIVPSTGQAPIETFISWPSGALAFAVLGMVVPLAEELFFRGFLFGALESRGRGLAFAVTLACFTAAHVQQAFGNWGALLAVVLTGAVLTGLRAATGSTLAPAACHLLYNFSLWMGSFGG